MTRVPPIITNNPTAPIPVAPRAPVSAGRTPLSTAGATTVQAGAPTPPPPAPARASVEKEARTFSTQQTILVRIGMILVVALCCFLVWWSASQRLVPINQQLR